MKRKYEFTSEADRLITAIYQQASKRDGRQAGGDNVPVTGEGKGER